MKFVGSFILLLAAFDSIYLSPVERTLFEAGLETKKIINGVVTKRGQFPYVMKIRLYMPEDLVIMWGTAALVTTQTALSAAHCVVFDLTGEKLPVNIMDGVLGTAEGNHVEKRVTFKEVRVHEGYNGSYSIKDDIATIILDKEVELDGFIKTIYLADKGLTFAGRKVFAVGWGADSFKQSFSEKLRYMETSVADPKLCSIRFVSFIPDKQICLVKSQDVCVSDGDSGSPLVLRTPERDVSVGILSAGTKHKKTCKGHQAIYTAISEYYDWILRNSVGKLCFVKL